MRRVSIVTLFAAILFTGIVTALTSSCAKAEPEDSTVLQQMAFDAWVEKHVIGKGISAVKQSNGMYVEFIEDGDQNVESSSDTVVWLRLDYTSRDIAGNVFVTRDSLEALRQRTFTPLTYYVPDYVFCGPSNYGMSEGRYFAMRNELVKADGSTMKMSVGSKVKLYVPAYLAYGSAGFSNDQGYGGQYDLGETKIIVEDLSVAEVVKDPIHREEVIVEEFATTKWGMGLTDTLTACFYLDTLFSPRADLLEQFPISKFDITDTLGPDSEANVWFIGRFLPTKEYPEGFIFDTNIANISDEFYNRRRADNYIAGEVEYEAMAYTPPDDDGSDFIPAFSKIIPALRKGQWARVVFTSAYGYGATGMSADIQEQQDYYDSYMQEYYQSYMYQNMYGGSYYDSGYYDNYYNNAYYNGGYDYYNHPTSASSSSEEERQLMTEIQPYTPLIFEIYIDPDEEDYL